MKVIYNAATDVLKIVFRDAIIEDFTEELPGVVIDYDLNDKIIALEINDASQITEDPYHLEHLVVEGNSLEEGVV